MIAELQAVIFAGGEGSKMYPLTEGIPKCLLPIGNVPMIWYIVEYLKKSGFKDVIVIVRENDASRVTQVLQSLFCDNVNFDMVHLPDEEELGTADALRLIKDKIKTDVLIVSSDIVTAVPLHRLVDIHRTYDASFTAMLSKRVELQTDTQKVDKKKPVDPNFGTRDLVAIDEQEGRLLFLSNEADLEQENISFKKSTLQKYPHIKIDTELTDCHLYIIKKWLIDYLTDDSKMENIKSDFVPHILRKQFSKPKKIVKQNSDNDDGYLDDSDDRKSIEVPKDIFSYSCVDEVTSYMKQWSGYTGRCLKDLIRCHAFVADDFCLRVNTLPAYTHINKQISKFKDTIAASLDLKPIHSSVVLAEKSQIGNDCLIGKSVTIGNNVTIKNSVIGEGCKIGSNIKISNSIVMSHVNISDGCSFQGSIICENADIQQKCSLTNCQVSEGQTVTENSEVKNEAIVPEEMEFEE